MQIFIYVCLCSLFSLIMLKVFQYNKGDDVGFFISRIQALSESLSNYGLLFTLQNKVVNLESTWYGYSPNLFYGSFLLIPCAYLHMLGVQSIICYRILLILGIVTAFSTTFYVLKKCFNDKIETHLIAVLSFVFVLIAPNLGDLLVAQNIRVFTLFCLPLGMYNLYQMFQSDKVKVKHIVGLIFAVTFNVLNHMLTAVILVFTLLVEFVYLSIKYKSTKKTSYILTRIIIASIVCLCLCASFIFPMLEQTIEGVYVINYGQVDINGAGNINTLMPGSLISFPIALMFADTAAQNNGGYLLFLFVLVYLCVKTKDKKYISFCIGYMVALLVLAILPLPDFFKIFQFRFRLYAVLNPLYILLLIYGLSKCSKKEKLKVVIFLLIAITIMMCFILIMQSGLPDIDMSKVNIGGGDYFIYNENYVKNDNTLSWNYLHEKQKDNIANTIQNLSYEYSRFEKGIVFVCPDTDFIVIPLTYYKGYSLFELIGEEQKFIQEIASYTEDGLILLDNSNQTLTGKVLEVQYCETTIQKTSNIISVVTMFFVCIFLSTYYFIKKKG